METSSDGDDSYKCIKTSFTSIVRDEIYNKIPIYDAILDIVNRTNKIIIKTSILGV